MRADAIGRVIDKLNGMQQTAKAFEVLEGQPSEELPAELPELPEEAAGEVSGRPDIIPAAEPELPELPDRAADGVSGRPEPVPHSRPELPEAAVEFCTETGLPMIAMADDCGDEEREETEVEVFS